MLFKFPLLGLLLSVPAFAASTLNVSDIMFTGYSTTGDTDDFSFVTFVPIESGTSIYFTDRAWTGTAFDTNADGDGELVWTANSDLAAGSVVIVSVVPNGSSSATLGTTTGNFGQTGLASPGESIFAFQGSANNPARFLHALNYRGIFGNVASPDNLDSLLPLSLDVANGNVILTATEKQHGEFQIRDDQGTLAAYKARISNPANWTTGNTDFPLSTDAFSVVPEPSMALLAVLGGAGFCVRRRK